MVSYHFNDIQSDYYQIPKSDLEVIKQEEEKAKRRDYLKKLKLKKLKILAEGKFRNRRSNRKRRTCRKSYF